MATAAHLRCQPTSRARSDIAGVFRPTTRMQASRPKASRSLLEERNDALRELAGMDLTYKRCHEEARKALPLMENEQNEETVALCNVFIVNIAKQAMKGYDDARAAIGAAVLLSCYHQSAAASSPSQKEAVEAVTHKVANAIDVAMQLDRKAVNAGMMVELHEAMVRAPAPVGKTLARRRGLAHLERLKDLCSPGGNISPGQSSRLLCLLSTLRSRNYLEVNNWEITNLCANVQRGCGELSVEEMQEVAAAVGHLPVAKYPRTALLLRSIAEEAVRRSAAIAGDCRAVLRAATAAAALHDSRAAALQLRKEILALQKQQLVEATAAVDVCGSEYLAALAFCCAMVVLGTAWCGGGGSSAGGGGGDVI